jgi:3-hydroxyacyl-[acyl-carrier-protein] dehydratase
MLKDHFYHIITIQQQENSIQASLQLNGEHEIFKGHFPHQPVVPGVCMLQMVKEVLNDALDKELHLQKAGTLKFIAPVDPRVTDDLQLTITHLTADSGWQVSAVMNANGVACFKMQGVFV